MHDVMPTLGRRACPPGVPESNVNAGAIKVARDRQPPPTRQLHVHLTSTQAALPSRSAASISPMRGNVYTSTGYSSSHWNPLWESWASTSCETVRPPLMRAGLSPCTVAQTSG